MRRFIAAGARLALAGGVLWLVIDGYFAHPVTYQPVHYLLITVLLLALGWTVARSFGSLQERLGGDLVRAEAELVTLSAAAIFVLLSADGGIESRFYPLVYIATAFLVSFRGPLQGAGFLATVALVEGSLVALQPGQERWIAYAGHLLFATAFGWLHFTFVRGAIVLTRQQQRRALKQELQAINDDARDFRLISAALGPESRQLSEDDLRERRLVGSVRAIREALLDVLEVAYQALSPYTCVLLLLDSTERTLKIKECISDSPLLARNPISAQEGALGGIIKTGRPVNLRPRGDARAIGYYAGPAPVQAFLGVPVRDGGFIRGVLAVDRIDDRPFSEEEEKLLEAVAREAQRAMEAERIFAEMDQAKDRQERFYQAFAVLNQALSLEAVCDRLVEATRKVFEYDVGVVTLYESELERHTVAHVHDAIGAGLQRYQGATFADNGGLVATAIKTGHPLPYVPFHQQEKSRKVVLDRSMPLTGLESIKVFPLLWKEGALGTLVVGSQRRNAFSRRVESMFSVVGDHAAVGIANARMYRRMEQMATTDGLTGLTNHRRFQELLEEALHRADRFGRKVSLILTDIDHFKCVNDTYGHPVGDLVLKKISRILASQARRTDVVARYGGEEFALIMEETGCDGAFKMAERIREQVVREIFNTEAGRFRVTLSLGIASYPDDAKLQSDLIERADQALYQAKHRGRNRSVQFSDV